MFLVKFFSKCRQHVLGAFCPDMYTLGVSETPLNLVNEYVCLLHQYFIKPHTCTTVMAQLSPFILTLLTNQTGENIIKQHA